MPLAQGPSHESCTRSVTWSLRVLNHQRLVRVNARLDAPKLRRMGLAEGPSHGTCTRSVTWNFHKVHHMVLACAQPSKACSHERTAGRCVMINQRGPTSNASRGPCLRSVAWHLHKVHHMELAQGPSHGPCANSPIKGLVA
eukprot:5386891-Pleurochrysis_carterae.AAC.2